MQCRYAIFELLDQILLIAAIVGAEDDFFGRTLGIVGDVEEETQLVLKMKLLTNALNSIFNTNCFSSCRRCSQRPGFSGRHSAIQAFRLHANAVISM